MKASPVFNVNFAVFLAFLYAFLFLLTKELGLTSANVGLISYFFLPAFVRIIAFLIFGPIAIPILFGGGLICVVMGWYDLGSGYAPELIVTLLTSIGAPIGAFIVAHLRGIRPDLHGMSPWDLLWLSAGCAAGNALLLVLALQAVGAVPQSFGLFAGIFIGDCVGAWLVLLVLRAFLPTLVRLLAPVLRK